MERFVRIQARYRGKLGVEVGVFGAVDHLRRAGVLDSEQEGRFFDIDDWFQEHLPNPPFYEDDFQVGVVPRSRQGTTPMPDGLILGPTSAGSKRQFSRSRSRLSQS